MVEVDDGDTRTGTVCIRHEVGVHAGGGVAKMRAGSKQGGNGG